MPSRNAWIGERKAYNQLLLARDSESVQLLHFDLRHAANRRTVVSCFVGSWVPVKHLRKLGTRQGRVHVANPIPPHDGAVPAGCFPVQLFGQSPVEARKRATDGGFVHASKVPVVPGTFEPLLLLESPKSFADEREVSPLALHVLVRRYGEQQVFGESEEQRRLVGRQIGLHLVLHFFALAQGHD